MNRISPQPDSFSLVEILIAIAAISILAGVSIVAVRGVRENARETRLLNDVTVLNNGIDAYRAAGGVIPAGASAEQVIAKLKTVADSASSTAFGPSGPFIDPRLQISMQSPDESASDEPRADYPNEAGYFYVRMGGAAGIKEFVQGEASAVVTEARQGSMSYTSGGGFLTAYGEQPAATPTSAAAPSSVAGEDQAALAGKDLVKFPRPLLEVRYASRTDFIGYNGETLSLTNSVTNASGSSATFPLEVRIVNSAASAQSQLQVSWNGEAPAAVGSPNLTTIDDKLYTNAYPFVAAQVISLDATRFTNSDPIETTIRWVRTELSPVFPAATNVPESLTYLQAGGPMYIGGVYTSNERPPVMVSLSNIEKLPSRYFDLLSGGLTVSYTDRYSGAVTTVTNSSFTRSNGFQTAIVPINVQGFGNSKTIAISASITSANTFLLPTGADLNKTINIAPTSLTVAVLPLKPIGLPPNVTITHSGDVPDGLRKYYTLTTGSAGNVPLNPAQGGVPIASAVLYSAPITNYPIATYTVVAQGTGPAGTEHWFTSSARSNTYIAITTVPLKYIGLNMFKANINGYVKGSIYMQAGDFAVLNAGATVEGNVYLPGLPSVFLPAAGGLVAQKGKAYNQANDAGIATNRITGREYTTEGVLADPQADTRKIVDLYGSTNPANYEFRATETSRVDGKVYRRADPPPVTSQKPGLPSGIVLSNAAITVSGTNTLAGGSYALTLNNTNSVLRLGSPGTITSYVFGTGSTWTGGKVEILGPVQIYFNSSVSMSDVTFGATSSIYQTGFVVMSNYSVSIGSGATVYGQFEARDSTLSVGNGGKFYGSAFAYEVAVSGQGYVDVSGGSEKTTP